MGQKKILRKKNMNCTGRKNFKVMFSIVFSLVSQSSPILGFYMKNPKKVHNIYF